MKKSIRQGLFRGLPLMAAGIVVVFVVVFVVVVSALYAWVSFQNRNLESLNKDLKQIPTSGLIAKAQIVSQIKKLQQNIDFLKIDDPSKLQLQRQVTLLKQGIESLPNDMMMTPKERSDIELDKFRLKKDLKIAQNSIINSLPSVISGIFFFLTVIISWLTYQTTKDKQITERFSKAIEQLESGTAEAVELGAIYSLERIANDSKKDCWTIVEILTALVREDSPYDDQGELKPMTSIVPTVQAALTVIGKLNGIQNNEDKKLNLGRSNLAKADITGDFRGANLEGSDLRAANLDNTDFSGSDLKNAVLVGSYLGNTKFIGAILDNAKLDNTNCTREFELPVLKADLSGASLQKAQLENANLTGSNLSKANLFEANLRSAYLCEAILTEAKLMGADLSNADLSQANLKGANLDGTTLDNTDLYNTNLTETKGLKPEQIKTAKNWEEAIYDPKFQKKLGIS